MDNPLMTQERWSALTSAEREKLRDLSGLTQQLIGFEGCRVEVIDNYRQRRRFIVGRSTGWKPCHIELFNRRSRGGPAADASYQSVKLLYKVR